MMPTEDAIAVGEELARRFGLPAWQFALSATDANRFLFARHDAPWSITGLGARAEFHFTPDPPRSGSEAHAAIDPLLDDLVHAALLNRGVMLTPFHNMALMGPTTTEADVDRVVGALDAVVSELFASPRG